MLLPALLSAFVAAGACGRQSTPARAPAVAASPALRSEAEIRDLDIAFFSGRFHRDPSGGSDLAHLGVLLLQRSRETGDPHDAIAAEEAARHSIRNRGARNGQARQILASALLAQHRFAEALAISKQIRDENPDAIPLRAAVGEIEMELGQYDSARVSFSSVPPVLGNLSVIPRLSRWAEIEGHPDRARTLLRGALDVAMRTPGIPREQLAWFWLRAGDIELRTGHPARADSAYQQGLALHPGDYRVLSALARSAEMQGRHHDAIRYGEDAIAETLDPATLGTLSDAYAALGDSARSAENARALEVAVSRQPGAYHRAWSLFLIDHDRRLPAVTQKIREELRTRQDVYGYDLLAWALHKQGKNGEALVAMRQAMREGTADAQLFYHAGMIERSLGHTAEAQAHLDRARAVNPFFHLAATN